MKQFLRISVSAAALSAVAAQAFAMMDDPRWPRWYVGLSGGVQFLQEDDVRGARTGKAKFDTGEIFTGSVGYMPNFSGTPILDNMRIEAELGYHGAGLNRGIVNGTATALSGRTQAWTYMGNLFYDFRNSTRWTPYVGAGAGGAHVELSNRSGLGNTSNSDSVMAYQFLAGLSYAPETIPMTEWSLGYRYLVLRDPEFGTGTPTNLKLGNMDSSNIEVGAKFRF